MGFYSSSHVLQCLATLILFIKITKRYAEDGACLFLSIMIPKPIQRLFFENRVRAVDE